MIGNVFHVGIYLMLVLPVCSSSGNFALPWKPLPLPTYFAERVRASVFVGERHKEAA